MHLYLQRFHTSLRLELLGFLGLGVQPTISLLVPLWALHLHASAPQIGMAVGATSLLPFVYAIPIGSLIDRLGPRLMLLVGTLVTTILYFLYPWFPSIWILIVLQLFSGIFQSMNWQSAQTYALTTGRDAERAHLMARFGSAANLGMLVGPLLAGALTEVSFRWAFIATALWCAALGITAYGLKPRLEPLTELSAHDIRPQLNDFSQAAQLMRNPAVLVVMLVTLLRGGVFSIRQSFFPVLLHQAGFAPATIGLIIALNPLAGTITAAALSRAVHRFRIDHLLWGGLAVGIVGQCIVPLNLTLTGQILLSLLNGAALGVSLPLSLTMLGSAIPVHQRGLSAGLRNGMNRLAATIVPAFLGILVAALGLSVSFYLIGIVLLSGALIGFFFHQRAVMIPASNHLR